MSIDGQPVEDPNVFDYRFATKPIGGSARIGILRASREMALNVALQPVPETSHDELLISASSPFKGAKVSNLSPALAENLRLDPSSQGVVIVEVGNGSMAQSFGFRRGDVVVAVNNTKITNTQDLERVTAQQSRRWSIILRRGGQQISLELRG
jgi:S1-C subfamily serine protease